MRSRKFQSLIGLILTLSRCRPCTYSKKFQSLIGLILTSGHAREGLEQDEFQSLIGLILTGHQMGTMRGGMTISIPYRSYSNRHGNRIER